MVFGRLFARSPLDDPREKAWTELRMHWLSEQFGVEALMNARVLLPTQEHFPEPFQGSQEDVERILPRLCQQLGTTDQDVLLSYEIKADNAAGTYEQDESGRTIIRLAEGILADAEGLVATLAHEIGHKRLLGERRLTGETDDHEHITDLVPVYFGAGVFTANCALRSVALQNGGMEHWSMSRQGYLTGRVLGYALALFAWLRDEMKPEWAQYLHTDSRHTLKRGLQYLKKTGDSLFRADTAGRALPEMSVFDLAEQAATGTPSEQVNALWTLEERGAEAHSVLDRLVAVVGGASPLVRSTALETLSVIGAPDENAERAVLVQLRDGHPAIRSNAATALVAVTTRPDEAAQELAASLSDSHASVVRASVVGLGQLGEVAAVASRELLKVIHRSLARLDPELTSLCLLTMLQFEPNPEEILLEQIDDREFLREVTEILAEVREAEAEANATDGATEAAAATE